MSGRNKISLSSGMALGSYVAKRSIGTPTGLWFYSNDIQGTYAELKAKEVSITQPEKQDWGGTMSTIKDQDGNEFQLISSPEPTKK